MTKYPKVSIVIATYNSEATLTQVLRAVRKQSYPTKKIEVLVIDGGSSDDTLSIAKKFKCRILKNPKVDQVHAKHTGYLRSKGRYMMLIDSDEIIKSSSSIENKVEALMQDSRVKVAISSGYMKPSSYPEINNYLNELGDPFTYFMYRSSKHPDFFIADLAASYKKVDEDKKKVVFDFSQSARPPFIELTSMAVMVDLKYIRSTFPIVLRNISAHTHLFYLLNSINSKQRKNKYFAVMKHDPIMHYSVGSFVSYLKKIRSRIKSNIYSTYMGTAGYSGREKYYSRWHRFKKFLFVPYTFSLFLPLTDSLHLYLTRKRLIYFVHIFLCFYTVLLIIFYYAWRILGRRTKLYGYGS